jgi:polynucleotide 5'-hydroxyl-kinase GRC3/NOL9
MQQEMSPIELPDAWPDAVETILSGGWRRVVVIGPTDAGKSSLIQLLAERQPVALLDLDPGQKMIGPPGTVSRGRWIEGRGLSCDRFVFVGSTSALVIGGIARAATRLAAQGPLIANTSGFVLGPGARLQATTIAALDADLVVAIDVVPPPLPKGWSKRLLALPRSPLARRKSQGLRRRNRQQALDDYLGSETIELSGRALAFDPAPPAPFLTAERPLCSLVDADDEDMAIGILLSTDGDRILVHGSVPPRDVACVRLGSIWASPAGPGWRLLDRLSPGWSPAHRKR